MAYLYLRVLCVSVCFNYVLNQVLTTNAVSFEEIASSNDTSSGGDQENGGREDLKTKHEDVERLLLDYINPDNIREFSRFLSNQPHLAGTPRDEALVEYIKSKWSEYEFDSVKTASYNVLLSYPNPEKPNKVQIIKENGEVLFTAMHKEELPDEETNPDIVPAYNAYAPEGEVIADPVYVNYGSVHDFEMLKKFGIDSTGKICIMRYGKLNRANKVKLATRYGCAGVVLYLDPSEMVIDKDEGSIHLEKNVERLSRRWRAFIPASLKEPNLALWIPGSGIQRGSLMTSRGDPLTPGYPAFPDVERINISKANLPKIPTQPIGYDDAKAILRIMGGSDAPTNWTGGLKIQYKLGPGFNERNIGKKIRLAVYNTYTRKTIKNVIGIIKGSVEKDRYVIAGNHRDAWVNGAVDASSGTAALMELTRVLGSLRKTEWRPRRTIVLCSWGAEEFGMIGSHEWVEENMLKLQHRAVSYLNLDVCASGNMFEPESSPVLSNVFVNAMKRIPSTNETFENLYEEWKASIDKENETKRISLLGGGTDHMGFAFTAGVPSINFWFKTDKKKYPNISLYPAYHTAYDTFELVNRYIDPDFKIHHQCSTLLGTLIHRLANEDLLPFGLEDLAEDMKIRLQNLIDSPQGKKLAELNISLNGIQEDFAMFGVAVGAWRKRIQNENTHNPLTLRQLNDQMLQVERAFIHPQGLPEKPYDRHLIYGVSAHDAYAPGFLPGIYDLLYDLDLLDSDERSYRIEQLKNLVSYVTIAIRSAIGILLPLEEL